MASRSRRQTDSTRSQRHPPKVEASRSNRLGWASAKMVSQTTQPVRRCVAFNCPGHAAFGLSVLNDEPYAPGRPG